MTAAGRDVDCRRTSGRKAVAQASERGLCQRLLQLRQDVVDAVTERGGPADEIAVGRYKRDRDVVGRQVEPASRYILLRFERLALLRPDQVDEAGEQIMAVLRAGRGLRVVLHREYRFALDGEAAVGAVEQRNMGLDDVFGQRVPVDGKATDVLPETRPLDKW